MNKQVDVIFVRPSSAKVAYQDLAKIHSAIEPCTWSLLLAAATRSKGYEVQILDCEALRLSPDEAVQHISEQNPRMVCFVLYGQNPNSGTTSMIGGVELGAALGERLPDITVSFVGSHTSALPREVLEFPFVDIVLLGEGVYAIQDLLKTDMKTDLGGVHGIGYKTEDGEQVFTPAGRLVPQEKMDEDLPGYAWDLLPYDKKPFDLYRAHFWHTDFSHDKRTPFAAIYTSLGCQFACSFCMINIVNRTSVENGQIASDFKGMRHWSPEFILKEFETLANYGVETIRISDEMFFLNKKYYEPILKGIIERGFKFNMWAYARVDTIRPDQLGLFKKAGINWLCLGIESGNQSVRMDVSKGAFKEVNIRDVVKLIQDSDIKILGNYMFGLSEDTVETMQETLDLALELNTEHANFYPTQALPGSALYYNAKEKGWELPDTYDEYAFLSYSSKPLPTNHLSAVDVLRFRDEGWMQYFTSSNFLNLVESKFGLKQRENVEEMSRIHLDRNLLGD
jgi:radical SAM superfamily enzyme YgiQ (UPF0313 family)